MKLIKFLIIFLMASMVFISPAVADDPIILNLGTVAPPNTPWGRQLNQVKNRIEKESEGRIRVRLFMGTAGGENSIVRQTRQGQLQAAGVSTGAVASIVPEMNVFELPYLFRSVEEADRILDNHLYEPVSKLLADYGFQLYLFGENGYRNFAAKGKCIEKPEDLAQLRMRAQESWVHEEMYRVLGGNPVRVSVPEVLGALQANNVQGFDNTPLFAFAASWHQAIDHWTISDHIYQPAVVMYNKEFFDGLPEDLQKILMANQKQETEYGRRLVRQLAPMLIQNLESANIKVCRLNDAQKKAFADKTRPVHQTFRQRGGTRGAQLLDIIEKNR